MPSNSTCRRIAKRNATKQRRQELVGVRGASETASCGTSETSAATDGSRAGAGDNLIGRRLQSSLMTRSARAGYCVARLPFLTTCSPRRMLYAFASLFIVIAKMARSGSLIFIPTNYQIHSKPSYTPCLTRKNICFPFSKIKTFKSAQNLETKLPNY